MNSPVDLGMNLIDATMRPAALVTATRGAGFVMSPMIALAMSSGSALFSSFAPDVPATSSVLVKVGSTEEKWTPVSRYSMRAESVNPSTAYLLAQYVASPGVGVSPASDAMLMMWPLRRGTIRWAASLLPRMTP